MASQGQEWVRAGTKTLTQVFRHRLHSLPAAVGEGAHESPGPRSCISSERPRFLDWSPPSWCFSVKEKKGPRAPSSLCLPRSPVLACSSSAAGEEKVGTAQRWEPSPRWLSPLTPGLPGAGERAPGVMSPCHRPSLPHLEQHHLTFSLVFIFFKQVAVPDQCLQLL